MICTTSQTSSDNEKVSMQAIVKNSFISINPSAMDVDGEIQFASESDSSPDTVNSPVINARRFYSQKKKPAPGYLDIVQSINGRKGSLHQERNFRTVSGDSRGFCHSRKSRNRQKRKSTTCLEKKQSTPKVQGRNIVKKIRVIAGIKAGKLLSDKSIIKAEDGKTPGTNTSQSPMSPENRSSQAVDVIVPNCNEMLGAIHKIVDSNDRDTDEVEPSWKISSSDRATLCCEMSENFIKEDARYESLETESEDEDVFLRYSSTANEEGDGDPNEEKGDVERSESLNSTWRNSTSESKDVHNESLPEENNQRNSFVMCRGGGSGESSSDLEVFDSSLCSIMDKSNKILSSLDFAMEDEAVNPQIVKATDCGCVENTDVISHQDLEKLHSKNVDCISYKSRESYKDPGSTTRHTDIHNSGDDCQQIEGKSHLDNRQACSVTSHGLFKYFKKAPKESKGLLSLEEKSIRKSQMDASQKQNGRTCVDTTKRSPKHNKIFEYTEDATIEKLSHLPGILPQNELIPSSPMGSGVIHTKRSRKASSSPKNGIKKLEQLYIDVGQKNFGHTTCPTCGMVYTKSLPDDVIQHSKYHHGIMQKLKFKGWKSERILSEYLDGRIIQVNPEDNFLHIKKVAELREIVDKELGFVYGVSDYADVEKVFLFISKKKIVGCAIAVPITEAYPVVTPQDETNSEKPIGPALSWCCSSKPVPALCGVSRIWVLKQARRQQIASRLIDHVRRHFIYGVEIGKNELAFSDPTPDGRKFAEKYSETPNFLVFR